MTLTGRRSHRRRPRRCASQLSADPDGHPSCRRSSHARGRRGADRFLGDIVGVIDSRRKPTHRATNAWRHFVCDKRSQSGRHFEICGLLREAATDGRPLPPQLTCAHSLPDQSLKSDFIVMTRKYDSFERETVRIATNTARGNDVVSSLLVTGKLLSVALHVPCRGTLKGQIERPAVPRAGMKSSLAS